MVVESRPDAATGSHARLAKAGPSPCVKSNQRSARKIARLESQIAAAELEIERLHKEVRNWLHRLITLQPDDQQRVLLGFV